MHYQISALQKSLSDRETSLFSKFLPSPAPQVASSSSFPLLYQKGYQPKSSSDARASRKNNNYHNDRIRTCTERVEDELKRAKTMFPNLVKDYHMLQKDLVQSWKVSKKNERRVGDLEWELAMAKAQVKKLQKMMLQQEQQQQLSYHYATAATPTMMTPPSTARNESCSFDEEKESDMIEFSSSPSPQKGLFDDETGIDESSPQPSNIEFCDEEKETDMIESASSASSASASPPGSPRTGLFEV